MCYIFSKYIRRHQRKHLCSLLLCKIKMQKMRTSKSFFLPCELVCPQFIISINQTKTTHCTFALDGLQQFMFHTRLRAKLSKAVPLWNKTVKRVVVVEMRRPTFLLITTHRDSRIYKTTRQHKICQP